MHRNSDTTNRVLKNPSIMGFNSDINESLRKSNPDKRNKKLPVSLLQEILMPYGITPQYELTRRDGDVPHPIFEYRVFITLQDGSEIFAVADGRSIKDAKHAAAHLMIEKLNNYLSQSNKNVTANKNNTTKDIIQCGDDIDSGKNYEKNPVQLLQEYTAAQHLRLPNYKLEKEFGADHAKQFTISCIVENLCVYGEGTNKKLAKRDAAYKMWTKLKESDLRTEITSDLNNESKNVSELKKKFESLFISSEKKKIEVTKSLQQNQYGKFQSLVEINFPDSRCDYIKLLEQISIEKNFKINYVNMEKKSENYECMAICDIKCGTIFHGQGIDRNAAKQDAALTALQYIKENLNNNS